MNAVIRGQSLEDATEFADRLASHLLRSPLAKSFTVLGPAPAPLTKLRGEHRAQLFLKGSNRGDMRLALREALAALPEVKRRAIVDIDPLSVL